MELKRLELECVKQKLKDFPNVKIVKNEWTYLLEIQTTCLTINIENKNKKFYVIISYHLKRNIEKIREGLFSELEECA